MKTKLNDFQSYSENPSKLLEEDLKPIHYFTKTKEVSKFASSDGVEELYQRLGEEVNKTIDTREYRKLFVKDLSLLNDLSAAGLKVLLYVLKNIAVKKDEITIVIEDCMLHTGYKSKVNIYTGIIDLLDKGILYRKVGTRSFFININCFYNGSRL